ncbi:EG45-like domain containing protein [Aristolochia californica]|uniref:EG45-like domain containing protein n=1 Tax=Aristolochia californica TaxID=171875 RepID=UPI0035DD6EE6
MNLLQLIFLLFVPIFPLSVADVGTAAHYSSPYLPTACNYDSSSFPVNNLFAAAADGIWDNGAACGREYLVRCLSDACISDDTIRITIVDYSKSSVSSPSVMDTTMVLSAGTFATIADISASQINIEFQQ